MQSQSQSYPANENAVFQNGFNPKWIEMDRNRFVLFASNLDSDLLNPFLSNFLKSILIHMKVFEFFKIHFNP